MTVPALPLTPVPLIREWHVMTPGVQAVEWNALVEWVVWIHDLYELSREERLPRCWAQHPGLVEELRSLKAWREVIYSSPEHGTAAHTARSWHGELRQTIAAAEMFWAPSCRAGHTDAQLLARASGDLAKQWLAQGPPVMASAPCTQAMPGGAVGPREVSHADMSEALAAGRAQIHSQVNPFYAQIDDAWWTRSNDGTTWQPCTDPGHQSHLDTTAARMRAADATLDQLRHE